MKNRLEELRKQRGIKQEDLANSLEVSCQTIGALEKGHYNPSITSSTNSANRQTSTSESFYPIKFTLESTITKQSSSSYSSSSKRILIPSEFAESITIRTRTIYQKLLKILLKNSIF